LAGYEDVNDADRLSHDPTFRLIVSESIWERGAALTSRVHSFETELLTQDKNLTGLAGINRELLARVEAMESSRRVVLDIDSTEIPVYGQQEQSAYNGHFEATCYHPLLLFNLVRSMPEAGVVSEKSPASVAIRSVGGPNGLKRAFAGRRGQLRTDADGLGSTKGRIAGIKTEMSALTPPPRLKEGSGAVGRALYHERRLRGDRASTTEGRNAA
jgi:hypothetical protein